MRACPRLRVKEDNTGRGWRMALIACEECGKSISDRAASCPHCELPLLPTPPPLPPDPTYYSTLPEQVRSLLSNRDATACPKCGGANDAIGWGQINLPAGQSIAFYTGPLDVVSTNRNTASIGGNETFMRVDQAPGGELG